MAATALPQALTAANVSSFAYKTVKDRMPAILVKVIDTAHRRRHDVIASHGPDASDDLKSVVGQLSELRYRMMTDKPILPLSTKRADAESWNRALKDEILKYGVDGNISWFKASWLFVECYMYRKLDSVLENSQFLHDWDPFEFQKEQALVGSLTAITLLADHVLRLIDNTDFGDAAVDTAVRELIQVCLWGNKFDLSISSGEQMHHDESEYEHALAVVERMQDHIVCNHLDLAVASLLAKLSDKKVIHFVLDNAGMELFSDLCLAEYLLVSGLAKNIVFHAKAIPWFVSDVTPHDLNWTLEMLRGSQKSESLRRLAHRWQERIDNGIFSVTAHPFWTTSAPFHLMVSEAPELYAQLSGADFLIVKGDMNYRKLVSDLDWPTTTSFSTAIRCFRPTAQLALRTLKADVCVGLRQGHAEELDNHVPDWMVTGEYAIIQFDPGEL